MDVWICWAIFLRGGSPWRGPCWGWSLRQGTARPGWLWAPAWGWLGRLAARGCVSEPNVEWGPSAPWS